MAVRPGLLPQVLEDRGRGGVAHRAGVVAGEQGLDRDARHGAGGQDDQPPGRRQAVGGGIKDLARGSRRWDRNLSIRGRRSARPASGRFRSSVRTWSASSVSSSDQSPSGPVPAIGTQAGTPRERTTTPQCSPSGSTAFGPTAGISTQATRAASAGSAAWISSSLATCPSSSPCSWTSLAWTLAQGDARQLALVLQVLEPLRPTRPGRVPSRWSPPAGRADPIVKSSRGVGLARRRASRRPGGRPTRRAGLGPGLPPGSATPRPADRAGPGRQPGRLAGISRSRRVPAR